MGETTYDHATTPRECSFFGCKLDRDDGIFCTDHAYAASEEGVFKAEVAKESRRIRVVREARREVDKAERAAMGVEAPEPTRLADLLSEPDVEVRYRIEGLWPADGRIVLAAPQKAGKTTLMGNLVRSLVDGDPFLGRFPTRPVDGGVILLDFEMSRDMLRRWLREQQIKEQDMVDVFDLRGRAGSFDIRDPDVRSEWADLLRSREAEIIIGDPIKPLADALGVSEHTEMGSLLTAFDALLTEAGASEGMWTHHFGHIGERGRGDSTMRGWPDAEWKLLTEIDKATGERDQSKPVSFWAFGRDVDQEAVTLEYEPNGRRLTLAGDGNGGVIPRRQSTAIIHQQRIMTFLESNPGALVGEIISGTGINVRKDGILRRMIEDGKVTAKPADKGRGVHHFAAPSLTPVTDAFDDADGA